MSQSTEALQPGPALTVDPQTWVPEERRYIRVGHAIAITENGVSVLTGEALRNIADIEALV